MIFIRWGFVGPVVDALGSISLGENSQVLTPIGFVESDSRCVR